MSVHDVITRSQRSASAI